ncbi:hypothetical protein NIA69_08100 [Gemmiger formicilis]|nr:hypothetical protein [Gemmiger formicilis]
MKKDEIKQKRPFAPGIQWQLMLFIGGITLFTLLLVWGSSPTRWSRSTTATFVPSWTARPPPSRR